MTLLELAERCEQATGPDRELDCRIRCVAERLDFEQCLELVPNLIDWMARPYTSSLDAAMTLVPEGWQEWKVEGWRVAAERPAFDAWVMGAARVKAAATPALALCAAALRARNAIAMETGTAIDSEAGVVAKP